MENNGIFYCSTACCAQSQPDKRQQTFFPSLAEVFFCLLGAVMQRELEYITNSSQTKFFSSRRANLREVAY